MPKKCCGITVFTSSGNPLSALEAESGKDCTHAPMADPAEASQTDQVLNSSLE